MSLLEHAEQRGTIHHLPLIRPILWISLFVSQWLTENSCLETTILRFVGLDTRLGCRLIVSSTRLKPAGFVYTKTPRNTMFIRISNRNFRPLQFISLMRYVIYSYYTVGRRYKNKKIINILFFVFEQIRWCYFTIVIKVQWNSNNFENFNLNWISLGMWHTPYVYKFSDDSENPDFKQ